MPFASRWPAAACLGLAAIFAGTGISIAQEQEPKQAQQTPPAQPGPMPAPTPVARPLFEFADQTVNLAAGAPSGIGSLILTVEGANLPTDTLPVATDIGQPADFSSTPGAAKRLNAAQGFQNWLIPMSVEGLKAVGTRERYVTIQYAGVTDTKSYSIDNATPAGFAWKVTGPPTAGITWSKSKAVPVTFAVGSSAPASNVKLSQPLLRDADSEESAEFQLCETNGDPCVPPSVLPAGRATTLYLRQVAPKALLAGRYIGTFAVTATELPQGDTFDATFNVTSDSAKWLGFGAILGGVLLSWVVTVFFRHLINRSRLRRIAGTLRLRLQRLAVRLGPIDDKFHDTTNVQIKQALAELDEGQLNEKGYIPDRIPSATQDAATSEFQPFVTRMNARIDGLEAVVARGLEPLADAIKQLPGSKELKDAIVEVDAKAIEAGVTPLADLTIAIVRLVGAARNTSGLTDDSVPQEVHSVRRLTVQIGSLNLASWLAVMLTTVLIGVLVLVLPDKGFGQGRDYIICLLWGLGIPVAGAQLATLNAGSAVTAFNLTRPS